MIAIEKLESRALLSAAAAVSLVSLDGTTLQIRGTRRADHIKVELKDENVVVTVNGRTPEQFAAAEVQLIAIKTFQGDDLVAISDDITIPAQIRTGMGRDAVLGGGGSDTINGGTGRDWIDGRGGDDNLHGEQGSDTLIGGSGNDVIAGGLGRDRLFGGADNDTLMGGGESDTLRGGAGDDSLDGGAGADRVHGGKGQNVVRDNDSEQDTVTGAAGDTDVLNSSTSDLLA